MYARALALALALTVCVQLNRRTHWRIWILLSYTISFSSNFPFPFPVHSYHLCVFFISLSVSFSSVHPHMEALYIAFVIGRKALTMLFAIHSLRINSSICSFILSLVCHCSANVSKSIAPLQVFYFIRFESPYSLHIHVCCVHVYVGIVAIRIRFYSDIVRLLLLINFNVTQLPFFRSRFSSHKLTFHFIHCHWYRMGDCCWCFSLRSFFVVVVADLVAFSFTHCLRLFEGNATWIDRETLSGSWLALSFLATFFRHNVSYSMRKCIVVVHSKNGCLCLHYGF